jgi:hypothetical protein
MVLNRKYRTDRRNSVIRTSTNVSPIIKKKITSIDIPIINGSVTKKQNGQHGPAITMGVPSELDNNANMFPIRLAQQQK